jgi:hypothetical protein
LDQGTIQQRLHHRIEVLAVSLIHFGGNLQRYARSLGNRHSLIDALFWRDTPQKGQIGARRFPAGIEVFRQAVVHRPLPVQPGQGVAL